MSAVCVSLVVVRWLSLHYLITEVTQPCPHAAWVMGGVVQPTLSIRPRAYDDSYQQTHSCLLTFLQLHSSISLSPSLQRLVVPITAGKRRRKAFHLRDPFSLCSSLQQSSSSVAFFSSEPETYCCKNINCTFWQSHRNITLCISVSSSEWTEVKRITPATKRTTILSGNQSCSILHYTLLSALSSYKVSNVAEGFYFTSSDLSFSTCTLEVQAVDLMPDFSALLLCVSKQSATHWSQLLWFYRFHFDLSGPVLSLSSPLPHPAPDSLYKRCTARN